MNYMYGGQNGMNMQAMQHMMQLQQQLQSQQQPQTYDQQLQMLQEQQQMYQQSQQMQMQDYNRTQTARAPKGSGKGKAVKAGAGKAVKGGKVAKGKGAGKKAAKPKTKKQLREEEKARREAEALKLSGKRRKITKRNPDAPKRGKSPYIFFSMEKREAVKQELGAEAKTTEIMKRVAAMWNLLDPSQKEIYNQRAEEDKIRYENEVKNFDGLLRLPAKGKNGKIKDPNAPKRGMSAFLLYSRDTRESVKAERPELKTSEISKVLGEKWKLLDDASKTPWVERAQVESERYRSEAAAYKEQQAQGGGY